MSTKQIPQAKPSYGDDFTDVEIILHPSQVQFLPTVALAVPGATVTTGPNESAWGAIVRGKTNDAHNRLCFFWDAGWNSVKETLKTIGVNLEWIE